MLTFVNIYVYQVSLELANSAISIKSMDLDKASGTTISLPLLR